MIKIPSQNRWLQTTRSDIALGNVISSFNMDFSSIIGKALVNRMINTCNTNTYPFITGAPVGFKYFDTQLWTVAGSYVHNSSNLTTPFGANTDTGYSTEYDSTLSDIEVFAGSLFATSSRHINRKAANSSGTGSWTINATALLSGSTPHMLCNFKFQNRLYVSDIGSNGAPVIYSISSSALDTLVTSSAYTLSFTDQSLVITFLRASLNRIWIGTVNKNNGKASVFEWDGAATQFTKEYVIESSGALACVIKNDTPWIVDTNGKILYFSSGTFIEATRLPVKRYKYLLNSTSSKNNRFIHPNGMALIDGKVNVLINNVYQDNQSTIEEFMSSGIYEYDSQIIDYTTGQTIGAGLYHKYSFSYLPVGTNTITDYGQNRISAAGGLTEMKMGSIGAGATGNFLAGASIYADASNVISGVFINDTFDAISGTTGQYATQASGYIVTSKILSDQVTDTWQRIATFYKKFQSASDFIVLKYRLTESTPLEISVTFTSSTTFTTTTNVLGLEKYEVEGIQGTGSGMIGHITKVDVTGSTYTVTLDETFTGASGTGKVRLQNWIKIYKIQNSTNADIHAIDAKTTVSNWIQFKIHMLFTGKSELLGLALINETKQELT